MENRSLADANSGAETNENLSIAGSGEQPAQQSADLQVNNKVQEPVQKPREPEVQKQNPVQTPVERSAGHEGNKKGINFSKHFNRIKLWLSYLSPKHIHGALNHYFHEYRRVMMLTRRPTKQEFKELSIMVLVGTLIVGGIGFLVQLLIQYL